MLKNDYIEPDDGYHYEPILRDWDEVARRQEEILREVLGERYDEWEEVM